MSSTPLRREHLNEFRTFTSTKIITCGDVIKGDPCTGESLLDQGRNASGVSVGGDRDRAAVIKLREGGAYVLGDRVSIAPLRDLTVLDVPPHRRLGLHVLRLGLAAAVHG